MPMKANNFKQDSRKITDFWFLNYKINIRDQQQLTHSRFITESQQLTHSRFITESLIITTTDHY